MKYDKGEILFFVIIVICLLLLVAVVRGQSIDKVHSEVVATGGTFVLEKSVVAGGGREMLQAGLDQHGTAGQSVAGVRSTGGQFSVYSGFWTPEVFAPTASEVTIGGRVSTADGAGIRNVTLTLTSQDGSVRTALTSNFGYYSFAGVLAGETYILTVNAKRYRFPEPVQVLQVTGDLSDVDFVANSQFQ